MYVKTDRDHSGARAVATAAFLRDRVAGEVPEATVALPLGYVAEDAAAVWWNIPGAPLSRQLSSDPRGALRTVVTDRAVAQGAPRQRRRADVAAGSRRRRRRPGGGGGDAEGR